MAGMDKSKVMKRGGMKTKVMKRGGKKTKVKKMGRGKKTSMQGGVEHYQDYVKRMFGGGTTNMNTGGPTARKRPKTKNPYYGITVDPKPKTIPKKKKPTFTPTKADDRGLNTGGTTKVQPLTTGTTSTKNVAKGRPKNKAPKAKRNVFGRIPGSGTGKGGKKTKGLTGRNRRR